MEVRQGLRMLMLGLSQLLSQVRCVCVCSRQSTGTGTDAITDTDAGAVLGTGTHKDHAREV